MKAPKKPRRPKPAIPAAPPAIDPSTDQIARCAYLLWEQNGCPAGRDMDFWLLAEAQIRQAHHQAGSQI